jgi:N-methylhydantoinase A
MAKKRTVAIGVDIGGTFTDFVAREEQTGRIFVHKSLTTPADPAQGVMEGLDALLAQLELQAKDVVLAIHGTTLITNALIERKGAPTGLITTEGFRDVIEIRTEMRYDAYDLAIEFPEPLVPRPLRLGVTERLNKDGEVLKPLAFDQVRAAAEKFRAQGVRSVAVCFLHSFKNDAHEVSARDLLRQEFPELSVSISSEVSPEIREYPRTSTTVANAYVQPITERYLGNLESQIKGKGYKGLLYLMLSSGGITTAETAIRYPIRLVESGPAGGVLATIFFGELMGRDSLIAFDMGGTTAKAALVVDGEPTKANEFEVARVHRFKKGSGLPLQIPVIEMMEIGAGGGSIAHIDGMGLLKVGPESAGASPGPASYGFGGQNPTVTDANLVLGYLDPNYFLGGAMTLDIEAARAAIKAKVADPLGLSVEEAAQGIYDVVNENMSAAMKVHSAEQGKDPRRSSVVAFGGAAPAHAYAVARKLKVTELICPRGAGVASALGFLSAPISFEFAQSYIGRLDQIDLAHLEEVYANLEAQGREMLLQAGVPAAQIERVRSGDMRYVGQGHEITVGVPSDNLQAAAVDSLKNSYYSTYEALYGHAHHDVPIEFLTCRVVVSGPRPAVNLEKFEHDPGSVDTARKGERQAFFAEANGYVTATIYDRYALRAGAAFTGPAIIEERESTAIVPPGAAVTVDEYQNLIIRLD